MPGACEESDGNYDAWGQVTAYFWFGVTEQMKTYLQGLPPGFWPNKAPQTPLSEPYVPPTTITFKGA